MKAKSVRIALLVVILGCLTQANALPPEGPYTNPANDHLYFMLDHYGGKTWENCEAEALTLGGHLATINDQAENDWVWTTFGFPSFHFDTSTYSLWIGLYNPSLTNGGEYVWVSGEPVTYTNWEVGQPSYFGGVDGDNSGTIPQNYAYMAYPNGEGKWHDQRATYGSRAIVEVVPEPATWSMLVLGAVVLLGGCRMRRRA